MLRVLGSIIRVPQRFFEFGWEVFSAVLDYRKNILKKGLDQDYREKALWLQHWSRRVLRALNVHCTCEGTLPRNGMLASTHVSYLDVLVIAAHIPCVFVAKSQVRKWPVVGWITNLAGTLYVSRENRGDVKRVAAAFRPIINLGLVAVVFPEGTSTNSHEVRPFYSSLFEPAVDCDFPITSAWVGYKVPEPYKVENNVCFWGDMGFAPHLIRLMSTPRIDAKLVFGRSIEHPTDRKEAARSMHEEAVRIATQEGYLTPAQ